MTPGEEALREAMRLEQARIYGTTLREHRRAKEQPAVVSGEHIGRVIPLRPSKKRSA